MNRRDLLLVLASFACSAVTFSVVSVRADQAAIDRALTERLVRALEEQVRATKDVANAIERCKR